MTLAALGCSEHGEVAEVAEPGGERIAVAAVTSCATVGSAWWNQAFSEQRGFFHVELDATPSAAGMDAVIGLGRGPVTQWSGLATAVRFNPQGVIDARSGATYRADTVFAYQPGTTYRVRFDVDVAARTYSVWVRPSWWFEYTRIGRDFAFRTGQAPVALDHVASAVDPSTGAAGTLQICDAVAVGDATTADGCRIHTAEMRFVNHPASAATNVMVVDARARVSRTGMDAVIGVSQGPADSFTDLAAAVRFWTDGSVQARDGDGYRADVASAYQAGQDYQLRFVIDLLSKTYSVFASGPGIQGSFELARDYRFRTQQLGAAALDRVAAVVDSSGRFAVCDVSAGPAPSLVYAKRAQSPALLSIDGGRLVAANAAATTLYSVDGLPIRSTARGGEQLARAPSGAIYLARSSGAVLELDALSTALDVHWTATIGVPTGQLVRSLGVFAGGELAVALASYGGDATVIRLGPDGAVRGAYQLANVADLAVDPLGVLVVTRDRPHALQRRTPDGALAWQRSYPGAYDVDRVTTGPDGAIAIFGSHYESIDLGTGPLPYYPSSDGPDNTFVASFSPTGDPRFAEHVDASWHGGLVHDGARIAFARTKHIGPVYSQYLVWNADGTSRRVFEPGFGGFGTTIGLALSPTRLYASPNMNWPGPQYDSHPFTIALQL